MSNPVQLIGATGLWLCSLGALAADPARPADAMPMPMPTPMPMEGGHHHPLQPPLRRPRRRSLPAA